MKANIVTDILLPIPSGKILVLELWAKILLLDQIAGFFRK